MYEYITGRVESLTPASAVVEAGGVGYFLNISIQTFSRIGSQTEVKLYTHFVVREDAQILYGFYDRAERDIFRLLIGVSGVGGNTARMILSSFTSEEVCRVVSTWRNDAADETFAEAVSALTMLGFARQAAEKVLRGICKESPGVSGEELVRIALKRL